MSKNVASFLNKLDKLSENTIEVFVPSLKKKVSVKPLNLKQQKDLISSVLDGLKGTLDFSKTLNKIIISNSGINDLKIYDKIPFVVVMRKNALGSKTSTVDLNKVIDNFKTVPFEIKDEKVIKHKDLKLTLKVPTLRQENSLLSKCEQEISADQDQLKEGVGKLYIYELLKYIDSVQVEDDTIELNEVKISERVKLVEKLPLSVYSEVSKFIETINKYNSDLLTVDDKEVSIDVEFFDTSIDD